MKTVVCLILVCAFVFMLEQVCETLWLAAFR
jgi:hypothetical protein